MVPKYFILYDNDTIKIDISMNKDKFSMVYKCNSKNIFELVTVIPITRWRPAQFSTLLHKLPRLLYLSQNLNSGDFYINYIYRKKWYEYWKESCIKTTDDFATNKSCRIFISI